MMKKDKNTLCEPQVEELKRPDWKWQQANTIKTAGQLLLHVPDLSPDLLNEIKAASDNFKLQITPYYLSLLHLDNAEDLEKDPLFEQVIPRLNAAKSGLFNYDGTTENWELPEEMVTPIAQHKYDNRVIIRLSNVCHSYCQFCYEALRTLEKSTEKTPFRQKYWTDTLEYIAKTPSIEEVVLSGGEPMMLSDKRLESVLESLHNLKRKVSIRLHTRCLTFNPFRITDEFIDVLERYPVNAIGLHVTHPREITPEFIEAHQKIKNVVPIIFANIPLLQNVNADKETMRELCIQLFQLGIIPHYLYHFMPFSPNSESFRTSVKLGIEIIKSMKRKVSNLAVPEFVLPHHTGKFTVPITLPENAPSWGLDANSVPIISYTNWRDNKVEYPA